MKTRKYMKLKIKIERITMVDMFIKEIRENA
jgi:hypothetical protein